MRSLLKLLFLSLESKLPFRMKTLRSKGQGNASHGLEIGPSLRNL